MSVSMLERGMEQRSYSPTTEKRSDRPHLSDIESLVNPGILSVAKHEYTHIGVILGVGESTGGATVKPTSEYQGATFHAGHMSIPKMQVAAMASAEHEGNGSDQMKAYLLQQHPDGISMEQAESIAKGILSSYHKDVLDGASVFLAYYGEATDAQLRQFIRWAEEDIKEKATDKDMPIPSWSDELDAKREERIKNNELDEPLEDGIKVITYYADGTQHFRLVNGEEKIYCTHCKSTDLHTSNYPNYIEEKASSNEPTLIFSANLVVFPEQEIFWRHEINSIFGGNEWF